MRDTIRIYSWNVNGLRACAQKGFVDWLKKSRAFAVGLQETRAKVEQLTPELHKPGRWNANFSSAERLGYSGVAFYSRQKPDELRTDLGHKAIDAEGRFVLARFGRLWLISTYVPNGSGKHRDNSRVPFKLKFSRRLFRHLEDLKQAGERVLVMGDFNTAHQEIDLARPKQNADTSGFLPEERAEMSRWLKKGWVDTFRHFEPSGGHYTWWSQRFGVRAKNIGWRIDYVLASPGIMPFVRAARIHSKVQGSDHCPISVDLDRGVLI